MSENAAKWYAVHTISGKEGKVKEYLEAEIAKSNSLLSPYVTQVLSPSEKVIKLVADGKKKKETDRLLFPGYVFVEAVYAKELPSLMKDNIPYVMGFVGNVVTKEPIPLTPAEVRRLKGYETDFETLAESGLVFQVGEKVKVISDPFNGFSGEIKEVNDEKKKLRVEVIIFGRGTSVELSFTQVEKEG